MRWLCSGYAGQLGEVEVDVGVVVVALKQLLAGAHGKHGDGQAGVAVAAEVDARLVVEDVGDGDAERLVAAVEDVLLLGELGVVGLGHRHVVGILQQAQLILGHDQAAGGHAGRVAVGVVGHDAVLGRLTGSGFGGQAEQFLHIDEHLLKGGAFLFVLGDIVGVVLGVADLLVGQVLQEGVVVGPGVADGQAAGLVVAGHQDQRLVGVLVVEGDGFLDRVGQRLGVAQGGTGVVGVAGPVDLAALDHHKEAGVVVEQLNALRDIVGQRPGAFLAVQLIGDGVAVGQLLADDDGGTGAGGQGFGLGLGLDDGVPGVGGQLVQVGLVFLRAGGLQQRAARKVVKAALDHFQADVIVVVAADLVAVEGRRGGVVEVDAGDDADLVAQLVLELFGNGLIGHGAGLVHVDGTAVGLVAGGDGGGGGSGVRAEAGAVVGLGAAGHGEIDKAQSVLMLQDRAVAAHAGAVFQRRQIVVGALDLGVAHTVANEQENVLGRVGGRFGRGFLGCGGGRGGCGRRGLGRGAFGRARSGAGRAAAGRQAQRKGRRAQQGHGTLGQVFHVGFLSLLLHPFVAVCRRAGENALCPCGIFFYKYPARAAKPCYGMVLVKLCQGNRPRFAPKFYNAAGIVGPLFL